MDSIVSALARLVSSCPVAVCVHVHERRESVDLDQGLCDRDLAMRFTFISSLTVVHMIFLAVSFTLYMMSARSWHISAVLNLIQRFKLFFCHVMRCWCLERVALLESEVFHEHVDMSGIVLIHNASLSPAQPSIQRFDAFR